MKKLLLTALLLAPFAQAADYFLPDIECDNHPNVRAAPNVKSKIIAELDYSSPIYRIVGKQGKWYRLQMGKQTGFVHQSQGYFAHRYQVAGSDGFANVREPDDTPPIEINQSPVIAKLPNGKTVYSIVKFNQKDWIYVSNQGDMKDGAAMMTGFVHRSQLKRVD